MKYLLIKKSLLLFVLSVSLLACKKEKYTLEYNLQAGEKYIQNMHINMNMNQELMGQKFNMSINVFMNTHFDIINIENDNIISDLLYDEIGMETDLGFTKMTFSSNTEDSLASEMNIGPMLKAMVNIPLRVEMTKKGKIASIKGYDKITESMMNSFSSKIDEDTKNEIFNQFKNKFDEEALKKSFEQISTYFPENPVAVGEKWNVLSSIDGEIPMSIDLKITLKNVTGNVATIEGVGNIKSGGGSVKNELLGGDQNIDLTGTQKGWIKIDMNTGWVIDSEIVQNMNVESEIEGVKVVQEIVNTTKVSGK